MYSVKYLPKSLQISEKWPKYKQYGQIARKTKYVSKTGKRTENRFEMVFMTKDQKECVFK